MYIKGGGGNYDQNDYLPVLVLLTFVHLKYLKAF